LACEQVFVPSALEAFVVASPLLPGDLSVDLLSVAVRQPAARFVTRQRAGERLGLDALPEVAADLEIDELLERARTLVSRIAMD
jgi:hypothetical protein